MTFSIYVDQPFCLKWGLNLQDGAVFGKLFTLSSWAEPIIIDGKVFYHASRNKILEELPIISKQRKPDTIYRIFKFLATPEVGVIEYVKDGKKDLVRITERGREWNNSEKNPSFEVNSEKNPRELGKKSEKDSEKNPTNNNTSIDKGTSNKKGAFSAPTPLEVESYFFEKMLELGDAINGPEFWAKWETDKFLEHYERVNWKVGRTKMKDWRRAVGGWLRRGLESRTFFKPCPLAQNYINGDGNTEHRNGKENYSAVNKADAAIAAAIAGSNGYSH